MDELFTTSAAAIVSSSRVLYTASAFARRSLLHIQEIGSLEAKRSHTSERSGLQSFLFFMVTSGSGTLVYDGKEYELTKDSCVFINCQKPYAHTTDSNNLWTLRWIHFYGPSLSSIYDKYCERGGRPTFIPAKDTRQEIDSVWKQLMATARSADYMRDMRINQLLSELMVCIMSESWHPEDKRQAPKRTSVIEIKEYLDNHYAERIVLDNLSAMFFIDKYYLAKSFKNQFGLSITTYLQNIRITKAKQLLRFSTKTVEEIGLEVGLGAPAYFSRVFKNVEGVSPSKYREQW